MNAVLQVCRIAVICVGLLAGCSDDNASTQRTPVIGLITNNPNGLHNIEGFRDQMTRLGYQEGSGVRYEFSGVPTAASQLDSVLQSFLAAPVDLIFTAGTPTGVAAHRVTAGSGVPVIFGVIADPLGAGVVKDLTRPGGNMTGVKLSQNQARRLEIFSEMVPTARRVLVPFNPDDPAPRGAAGQIRQVSQSLGIELLTAEARSDDDVTKLLAALPRVDAIFMVPDSTVNRRVKDLLEVANRRRIPVSGPSVVQVEAGALMTYGFIHRDAGAQAARIADRVLRGADPGTLPVETAEDFLQINTAAAQRIGGPLSDDLLQRADVILRHDKLGQP